jgi:hypothetical protein
MHRYVRTVTRVLEVAGDLVQSEVASNLMVLIAEGSGDEDESLDHELRCESVAHLAELLITETMTDEEQALEAAALAAEIEEQEGGEEAAPSSDLNAKVSGGGGGGSMPPVLMQIISWVLGEYGSLVAETVR